MDEPDENQHTIDPDDIQPDESQPAPAAKKQKTYDEPSDDDAQEQPPLLAAAEQDGGPDPARPAGRLEKTPSRQPRQQPSTAVCAAARWPGDNRSHRAKDFVAARAFPAAA